MGKYTYSISGINDSINALKYELRDEIDKSRSYCIEECNQALSSVSKSLYDSMLEVREKQDMAANDISNYKEIHSDMHIEINDAIKKLKSNFNIAITLSACELLAIIGLICKIFFTNNGSKKPCRLDKKSFYL